MATRRKAHPGTASKYSPEHRASLGAILEDWSPEEATNSPHLPQDIFDAGIKAAQQVLLDRRGRPFEELAAQANPPLRKFVRAALEARAKRCIVDLLKAGEQVPADWSSFTDLADAIDVYMPDLERGLDLAVRSSWVYMEPHGAQLLTPTPTDGAAR